MQTTKTTFYKAIITIAILGFGLLGLSKLQTTSTQTELLGQEKTEATKLAKLKIAELKIHRSIYTKGRKKTTANIPQGSEIKTKANVTYTIKWHVIPEKRHPAINITVTWINPNNQRQSIYITGLV